MALSDPTVAIVGGGITGLAAALRLGEHLPPNQIAVVERERSLGGKIGTERTEGFVIEAGPVSIWSFHDGTPIKRRPSPVSSEGGLATKPTTGWSSRS